MKESIIIDIVEDNKPLPFPFVAQPAMNELKNIGLGIRPTRDLDLVCNLPIALLETGRVARVDPEDPCLRGSFSDSVRIFDSKLRLP